MASGAGDIWLTDSILYTSSVFGESAKWAGIPLHRIWPEPASRYCMYEWIRMNQYHLIVCKFLYVSFCAPADRGRWVMSYTSSDESLSFFFFFSSTGRSKESSSGRRTSASKKWQHDTYSIWKQQDKWEVDHKLLHLFGSTQTYWELCRFPLRRERQNWKNTPAFLAWPRSAGPSEEACAVGWKRGERLHVPHTYPTSS